MERVGIVDASSEFMLSRAILFVAVCASSLVLSHGASAEPAQEPCGAWDIEYSLGANLELTDTPMGKGNGTYKIGPGSTVLRFDDVNGQPGGNVQMRSYAMREWFTVVAKAIVFTTTVVVDSKTKATPNACGSVAEGELTGGKVLWTSKVRGYRTDGTVNCDGTLCGSFGAPPSGTSPLHLGPNDVRFKPFELSKDLRKLSMPSTFVSKSSMPQQTAFVTLTGYEMKRTCVVAPKPCP